MPIPRFAAAAAAAVMLTLVPPAVAAPGDLDASFGAGGRLDFRFAAGEPAWLTDVVVGPDGSLVAVGTTQAGGGTPALALSRFASDGTRSLAFGDGGLTRVSRPGLYLEPRAAARAADGKLLVAGNVRGDDGTHTGLFVARFDADGDLDPAFGDGGVLSREVGVDEHESVSDLVIDGEGRLVIGAAVWGPLEMDGWFTVLRLLPDGTPDPSFGTGGEARMNTGTEDAPLELAIEPDDDVLAVAGGFDADGRSQLEVVRLTEAGALDPSFGTNGLARTTFGAGVGVWPYSLSRDASGRIVVAGQAGVEQPDGSWIDTGAFARFTPGGALDATFDADGMATGGTALPLRVRVAPGGGILFAGSAPSPGGRGFAVGGLLDSGAFDTGFGSSGLVVTEDDSANAWVLELAGGHAVVAGTVAGQGRVYRYAVSASGA